MMRVRVSLLVCVAAVAAAVTACEDPDHGGGDIAIGAAVQGELSNDDHAMPSMQWSSSVDASELPDASYEGNVAGDTWTLTLAPGDSVQVVMCASVANSVLDPYLIVDFDGARILADDDSAGDVNARVQIDSPAGGTYTIYATAVTQTVAYQGERGYLLRVDRTPAEGEPPIGCE